MPFSPDSSDYLRMKKLQLELNTKQTLDPLKTRSTLTYGSYNPLYKIGYLPKNVFLPGRLLEPPFTGWLFSNKETIRSWQAISMSDDGTKLVAAVSNGQIYVSNDSGETWTATETARLWSNVKMSGDGNVIIASYDTNDGNGTLTMRRSTDGGQTWSSSPLFIQFAYFSFAMSSNGSSIYIADGGGRLYKSTNSGGSWSTMDSTVRSWNSIACSADGTKIFVTVNNGQIYVSTNSGTSFTARDSNRLWRSVDCSADGSKLIASVYNGKLYISTNTGETWSPVEENRQWLSVSSSADGTVLIANADDDPPNGGIYTSLDAGLTWSNTNTYVYIGLTDLSSDGKKLSFISYDILEDPKIYVANYV